MERGRGRGPGPGPSRGLDRVASVLGVGRSVGLGIGPGRAEGVAVQGQSNIGEGPAPPQLSKPGSGRKAACVESGLASAYALEGARGGKGVAGQGPSDTGGAAAPPRWAKPGSGGREPSPGPAPPPSRARKRGQATMASPGKGRATQGRAQPLPASPVQARHPLTWGRPGTGLRAACAPGGEGFVRQGPRPMPSDAGEGAASPHRAKFWTL